MHRPDLYSYTDIAGLLDVPTKDIEQASYDKKLNIPLFGQWCPVTQGQPQFFYNLSGVEQFVKLFS